jgi:hypothetical protein
VGNYPHHRVAALVYGANVSLILLFEILMWWHATRRLFDASPSAANAAWRHARRRFVAAIVATAFAIAVAMAEISAGIGVVYSSYCYLLLLLIVMFRDEAQGPPE